MLKQQFCKKSWDALIFLVILHEGNMVPLLAQLDK